MKYFCSDCGRPVPLVQKKDSLPGVIVWEAGRCATHPKARRYSDTWARRQLQAVKDLISKSPALASRPVVASPSPVKLVQGFGGGYA